MSPGAVIAVGFWGGCGLVVAVGSVWMWIEEQRWRSDERRLSLLLPVWTVEELEELERMRSGAAFAEAIAVTLAEIRSLPQTPPVRRSTWS